MKLFKLLGTQAPLIFVVLTAVFLTLTGTLRFGSADRDDADETAVAAVDPHAGHGHGPGEPEPEAEPAVDPHAGHDHGPEADAHEDEPEVDPHAGHNHGDEADEHDEADVHEEADEADEVDGHDEAEADPHAGHDHGDEVDEHEDEPEVDPHAGHNHPADWCDEHGVAESACTRCNPSLIAAFKARGDWCGGHGLPESQCVACNPGIAVPATGASGSLDHLESFSCEHGTRTLDCDDCRFGIGVVKVDASVADSLLRRGRVERRATAKSLRLTGEVQLDRTRVVEVPAPAGGRVETIACDLGKEVGKNDLLAVLHSGEIAQVKATFLEKVTACEIAEQERQRQTGVTAALEALLEALPREIDRPLSGEDAEAPEAIPAGLVGEWKSKLVGAASRLRMARIVHTRERDLEEKGISARAEHEEAHEAYDSAKAEYAALIEEVKLGLTLDALKAESTYRQACAGVMAAEQRLRVYGVDDKGIDLIRTGTPTGTFAHLEIRAPRKGTVTQLDVSAGRYVESDRTLFTIADLGHLWVWCDLYERDIALVSARLAGRKTVPATIRTASFPGVSFPGTLDLLDSEMDVHTRTVKARIQVSNPGGRLRPGMFVDVELRIPGKGLARVVPRSAILNDEGRSFVFQYWKDEFWVRRDVVVRELFDDLAAIEGDLPEGATIAIGGAFMLKSDVLRDKMGAG